MTLTFLKKIDKLFGPILARLWPRPARVGLLPCPVDSLLLIRPGGIGDAILLIPTIKRLREVFPSARLEVLAEKRNSSVLDLCPGIDNVLCYDRPRELLAVLKRNYDVVIDTEQWHYLSALVARVIRSGAKIGFGTNIRKRLFTHPVEYSRDNYELKVFFELLKPLRIETPETVSSPFLTVHEVEQVSADAVLGTFLEAPFVTIFPGASIPEKCWAVEKYRQLAIRIIDLGFLVVIVGGKEDTAAGSTIVAGLSALNLAGKTSLHETAGVLNRTRLLISGDSGVLHMGIGLGQPTVSIFGPSSHDKWAPHKKQHVVISLGLPCSPCVQFGTIPPCPIGGKCIQDISVDEVFTVVLKTLNLK